MLVEHHPVETYLLAVLPFVKVIVVLVGGHRRIKVGIGEGDAVSAAGTVLNVLFGVIEVGPLGKSHYEHGKFSWMLR